MFVSKFHGLSALDGCWSSVFIRMIIYKVLKVCPFNCAPFVVSGKVGIPKKRFNQTSWVAVVTQTSRPKSVRNRCFIEVFGGFFLLSCCFWDFSVGVGTFVIELNQISSFFSSTLKIPLSLFIFLSKTERNEIAQ